MTAYQTEAEQIQLIKQWWKEYGKATLFALVAVLIVSYGWRWYQIRHEHLLQKASAVYERLLTAAANNDMQGMQMAADRLSHHYTNTPYAQLAALMLARQAVYQGQFGIAEAKLKWIMRHGGNRSLRQVARIRLARVLLTENKTHDAEQLLKTVDDNGYLALIEETRGDIYQAVGKTDDARIAYRKALEAFPEMEVMQPLLQMKLDNLPAPVNT